MLLRGNVKLAAKWQKLTLRCWWCCTTTWQISAIEKMLPAIMQSWMEKEISGFTTFPADTFNVFVVPNDYTKRYDDSTKLFAFASNPVFVKDSSPTPIVLYAYQENKATTKNQGANSGKYLSTSTNKATGKEKKPVDSTLKMTTSLENGKQDFLKNLELTFSDTLQQFDTGKFHFTDTSFSPLPGLQIIPDTVFNKLMLTFPWKENTPYKLVIEQDAVSDSAGRMLAKNDTLSFVTLRESDYGSIRIRFQNLDTSKHPVLQLVQNDKIVQAVPLTNYEWFKKFILPGEYELRMLYDANRNGVWDAGSYVEKRQPEVVQSIVTKGW